MKSLVNSFLNELLTKDDIFKELGTILKDEEIEFLIHTKTENFERILNLADYTFHEKYIIDYLIINFKYKVSYKISFTDKAFNQKDIQGFTYHYFIPEITKNRYIFKYLPDNKNLTKLLKNNSFWFGNPLEFSDITDCKFEIDTEPSEENIINFYYSLHTKNQDNSPLSINEFSKSFDTPSLDVFNKDLLDHHHKGVFSKLGITCFTETYDNKLMWDSYADGSKGVCIIFDTTETDNSYYELKGKKVRYFKNLPKHFFDGSGCIEVGHIICSKTKDYKYESEIREFLNFQLEDKIDRKVEFNPKILKGIIFGANCRTETKERIQELIIKKKYGEVELIQSYTDNKLRIKLERHKLKLREKTTANNESYNTPQI